MATRCNDTTFDDFYFDRSLSILCENYAHGLGILLGDAIIVFWYDEFLHCKIMISRNYSFRSRGSHSRPISSFRIAISV